MPHWRRRADARHRSSRKQDWHARSRIFAHHLNAYQCLKTHCVHQVAVCSNQVPADSLRKTGISIGLAGDFAKARPEIWEMGVRRQDRLRERPAFSGPVARGLQTSRRRSDWLAGAGGIEPPNGGIKIRCLTAWLRPNAPLQGTAGGQITADSSCRSRSIERSAAFQPPAAVKFASCRDGRSAPLGP